MQYQQEGVKYAHKKAWYSFCLHWFSEVLDYLFLPITTYKPTLESENIAATFWEKSLKSVQVFRKPDKLLRYFLFFDVHIETMHCAS